MTKEKESQERALFGPHVDLTPGEVRELICELCRLFYGQGWVSGTGGGISIRRGDEVFIAPSGVQKERIAPEDIFVMGLDGEIRQRPDDRRLKISACTPLFMHAYRLRDAGAVLHSHSMHAMLATLIMEGNFSVTGLEMMKGIQGVGVFDVHEVPIIDNTAYEEELADSLRDAIVGHPSSYAVLVRGHGVYVWGKDWIQAKTQAECYDYLFEAAVKMKQLGVTSAGT